MKLIYTAIFGNYDKLWEPKVVTEGWEYVCYTDQNFESNVWQIINIDPPHKDLTKASKFIKIMKNPEEGSDLFVWVDGSIEIRKDIDEFISKIPECELAMQVHPFNSSLQEELEACIRMNKDDVKIMREQVNNYTLISPYQFTQNNIIVKRKGIQNAMRKWWTQVDEYSKRDQLSFIWSMQQCNQNYCTFSNSLEDEYFLWHKLHEK
jgi:hypothetical protein